MAADLSRWKGGRSWRVLTMMSLAGWALCGPALAEAQRYESLEQVEQLANRGDLEEAQRALALWESDHSGSASLEERAWAWFLAGRLAQAGAEAELHYIRVVIEGSTTRWADDALLRLGQYKYAQGEHARAMEYLTRLRRDYPASERAAEALLWIARVARELGDGERACAAVKEGLKEAAAGAVELRRSLQDERAVCRVTGAQTYTVQVAAFQDERSAQDLARRLLRDGYDAWVLAATGDDPLHRVRVGRDLLEGEAQALLERLGEAGYSPFLVSQPGPSGGER